MYSKKMPFNKSKKRTTFNNKFIIRIFCYLSLKGVLFNPFEQKINSSAKSYHLRRSFENGYSKRATVAVEIVESCRHNCSRSHDEVHLIILADLPASGI